MYVCGITPYDATHMGHAFTYVTFDVLNRIWRDQGLQVDYAQNVTDIDDPLLERAHSLGQDWHDIAHAEIVRYREDMAALRVLAPSHFVGVVESMELIADSVQELIDRGVAYPLDSDWYYDITSDPAFGSVSSLDPAEQAALFSERGGDPQRPGKRHTLDCLLWRGARPGEPQWSAPFGAGRPGWHIECSAIAKDRLGLPLTVQGGGSDLLFPHHEMTASLSTGGPGIHPFAGHFVHSAMVGLDGQKMSKSLGNLEFVSRLTAEGTDPMAIRLALLAHHYRADWEWSTGALEEAQRRLQRWRNCVADPTGPSAEQTLADVRLALADDLDIPAAIAAIDRWCSAQENRSGDDPSAPGLISRTSDALLGVAL